MYLQPFLTNLSNIGKQIFLRCDPKYRHFWDNQKGIPLPQTKYSSVRLKSIVLPYAKTIIKTRLLDIERPILELNDVESRTSLILQERLTSEVGSDKLDFTHCDLVVSRLEPYLGKIVVNNASKKYIGTTEWIPIKLNQRVGRPLFLKYLLLLPQFLNAFSLLKSGKRHARMNIVDFYNMFITLPPLDKQGEVEEKIAAVEDRMVLLNGSLVKSVDIINHVFSREFGYSLQEYEKRATEHTYQKRFTDFHKSALLRSSTKFHHPKYDYLEEIMTRYPCVKLRTLLKDRQRIHKGVVPEYSEDGEVMVLKTANLRHGSIDYEICDFVSQKFWAVNKVAQTCKGEILVSCHGEGRGKVDIYDKSEAALIDINTAVVPIEHERINPYYCTFFMQSLLGKFQFELLESETKAVRYMKPESLEQMRIIDPGPKMQEAIATEIRAKLKELQGQRAEIERLRDQIDKTMIQAVIEEAVRN